MKTVRYQDEELSSVIGELRVVKNGMSKVMRVESGYSLVEILTVMVIIGASLLFALPNFQEWAEKNRINAESDKVYIDLMLARTTAVKNNNNVIVTFDAVGNTYKVHDDTDDNGAEDSGENIKTVLLDEKVQFGINGSVLDIDGNTVTAPIVLGGDNIVVFSPRGHADTSGSVFLIPKVDVGVKSDRMRSVSILQSTGSVDLWKYQATSNPPWG